MGSLVSEGQPQLAAAGCEVKCPDRPAASGDAVGPRPGGFIPRWRWPDDGEAGAGAGPRGDGA